MPAFASKGHLIRSFNKLGDLLLTFGKQNKKPHAEQKATNDYGQAKFEPARLTDLDSHSLHFRKKPPSPIKLQSNGEVRDWYNNEVSKILPLNEMWIKEGVPLEERAKRAHDLKHQARLKVFWSNSNGHFNKRQ